MMGNIRCGLMSQERWTLLTNCTLEYDIGSTDEIIEHKTVENLQGCARLAKSTSGGLYWTYDQVTGNCSVKKSDKAKREDPRKVSGYRECAFLSQEEWSERVVTTSTATSTPQTDPDKLNSEERSRVENILRKPKECPENHEDKEETAPTEHKITPIIDLFLNPARSEELKDLLKQSDIRTASASRTKVTNRNVNIFVLLFLG